MAWHSNLSTGVVIVLLIAVLYFYIRAIRRDIFALHKFKDNKSQGVAFANLSHLTPDQITDIRNIYVDMTTGLRLHTAELAVGAIDGATIGFLSGAIVGGMDLAIGNAFVWAIIKTIIIGISQTTL